MARDFGGDASLARSTVGPELAAPWDLAPEATEPQLAGPELTWTPRRTSRVGRDGLGGNLVELMATSTTQAADASAVVHAARDALATLPPTGLAGPLESAAASLQRRVDQFGPPLAAYVRADTILPAIAGWTGQRRYLVLAEDPAELRPTGGFAGTYGIVTFAGGRITSHVFQNTLSLDLRPGQPYVTPPTALEDQLSASTPWQLADANWSRDFPT